MQGVLERYVKHREGSTHDDDNDINTSLNPDVINNIYF